MLAWFLSKRPEMVSIELANWIIEDIELYSGTENVLLFKFSTIFISAFVMENWIAVCIGNNSLSIFLSCKVTKSFFW